MPRGLGRLGRRGLLVQLASVVPRATGETLDRWGPQGRRDRGGGQNREVTWVLLGLLAALGSKGYPGPMGVMGPRGPRGRMGLPGDRALRVSVSALWFCSWFDS